MSARDQVAAICRQINGGALHPHPAVSDDEWAAWLAGWPGMPEARPCPRCDGTLQLRTGPYGLFWGCSNYPQCRYTEAG